MTPWFEIEIAGLRHPAEGHYDLFLHAPPHGGLAHVVQERERRLLMDVEVGERWRGTLDRVEWVAEVGDCEGRRRCGSKIIIIIIIIIYL